MKKRNPRKKASDRFSFSAFKSYLGMLLYNYYYFLNKIKADEDSSDPFNW